MERPTAPPAVGEKLKTGPWEAGKPAPDLVPGQTDDGKPGFIRVYDMANMNPEQQRTRRVDENTVEIILPVYAEDGHTQIGKLTTGVMTSE